MNFYAALIQVRIPCRIVDELRELPLAHLRRAVTKHKKERIDRVRFPGTIGAYDGRKRLPVTEVKYSTR